MNFSSRATRLTIASAMALAFALPAPLWAQQSPGATSPSGLPSLGDGASLTISAERRLGDEIAREIYKDPDYLDDPVLSQYLLQTWMPLVRAAQARGDVPAEISGRMAWELMIARDRRVNAFALPGGYMGVNLGLIAVTESRSELASVLAHELTHVSQRHIARMITQQDRTAPLLMGAMVLGAIAAGTNVDVANAAIMGSQALAVQAQLNFSRDMEREADRIGFGVMTEAGYEGEGFVSMFDKLQQASRLNDDGAFPYLRSHPLTSERMADMRSRIPLAQLGPTRAAAEAMGGSPARAVDAQHLLMAARARVLAESKPDLWRAWEAQGLADKASVAEQYAGALSAMRLGQLDNALTLANRLKSRVKGVDEPVVDWLLLEIGASRSAGAAARSPGYEGLARQMAARTDRSSVLLGAQALMAMGRHQDAVDALRAYGSLHPRDALIWQQLSRAYAALGQRLRSVRADAEAQMAYLDYAGAVARFKAAQALPLAERNADPMEQAIVDARLREAERLRKESVAAAER
ncbi:M48 family metalloprotease [Hydrogenophaga sp. 5NK40-0174]|uniref:M48 family metalloprotease n=1 Tax=Hydrogenophaga sp. 5NK40-0174 TaxID=3127649 RepID=UPI003109F06C